MVGPKSVILGLWHNEDKDSFEGSRHKSAHSRYVSYRLHKTGEGSDVLCTETQENPSKWAKHARSSG